MWQTEYRGRDSHMCSVYVVSRASKSPKSLQVPLGACCEITKQVPPARVRLGCPSTQHSMVYSFFSRLRPSKRLLESVYCKRVLLFMLTTFFSGEVLTAHSSHLVESAIKTSLEKSSRHKNYDLLTLNRLQVVSNGFFYCLTEVTQPPENTFFLPFICFFCMLPSNIYLIDKFHLVKI